MPKVLNISEFRGKPLPENAVYIGRNRHNNGAWGNPFVMTSEKDRELAITLYRGYLKKNPDIVQRAREELRGKDLVCYCAPKPCHGDILLEVANG